MITLCLDESGKFEDCNEKIKFIGGLIYTGDDYEEEKQRIESSLINLCKQIENSIKNNNSNYEFNYPKSIHVGNIKIYNAINHSEEKVESSIKRKAKVMIEDWFLDYIKKSGKYKLTCLVKDPYFNNESRVKTEYGNKKVGSNILNLHNASNLYERMVCRLIYNNILYNPQQEENDIINLEIAKRTVVLDKDNEKLKEYKALGYNINDDDDKIKVYLTDQKTFKAALTTKLYESSVPINSNINLNVESIFYWDKEENSKQGTTPYLYMADFACGIIRDWFKSYKSDFDIIDAIKDLRKKYGLELVSWIYGEIDFIWSDIIESFKKKDLIGCLSNIYDLKNSSSKYTEFYEKYWIEPLMKKIDSIFDKNKMQTYLEAIESYMTKESQNYEKGLYLGEELWKIITVYDLDDKYKDRLKYKMADVFIRGYNHRGDLLKAQEYFEICKELRNSVTIDEYIATLIRAAEIDANSFDFKAAETNLEGVLFCIDELKQTYEEIAGYNNLNKSSTYALPSRGKILSSLGQFSAFQGCYDEAKEYFLQALEEFTDDINKKVTLSFLLHLFIDNNDRSAYEKDAVTYFGVSDLQEQFNLLINSTNKDNYALFVYIKALNVFYEDVISKDFINYVINMDYEKLGFKVNVHPWQLIYKHMAYLAAKTIGGSRPKNLIEKAINCVDQKKITIDIIDKFTEIDYLNTFSLKDSKSLKEINSKLTELRRLINKEDIIKNQFKDFLNAKDEDISECVKELKRKIRYMYV